MQIVVDKVDTPPSHALSRHDVQVLIQSVPPEWLKYINNIRLSAALNTSPDRYIRLDVLKQRLTVCSRYLTADRTRQEILRALASHTIGLNKVMTGLSKSEWKDVDRMIAPVLAKVKARLSTSAETTN